ncbi:hypothetical protein LguiB_000675 [Lonicera macranthoides]
MDVRWRYNRFKLRIAMIFAVPSNSFHCNCRNLKDLCLGGTLAPELGKLTCLKSIILRNNSLWGNIPSEIGELQELEVLDLGYNNFSGPLPFNLGNNLSLSILLLDNNEFLSHISLELSELKMLSEFQVDENQLTGAASGANCNSRKIEQPGAIAQRGLLQVVDELSPSPSPSPSSPLGAPLASISYPPSSISSPTEPPSFSPSESLAPSPSPMLPPSPANLPIDDSKSPQADPAPLPSPASTPSPAKSSKSKHHTVLIWSGVVGGSLSVFISAVGLVFWRRKKVVTVNPWATGLSGQLQKAFVTGVPKLQRSELETACEDFSNIIGSLSDGTVYKGTLSSGVEIGVTSTAVKSANDWSENLEAQFRNKAHTLSKVNHKNFVNLIGFCEEEKPFTRMMVFEYAPNGTLFEHLHIKEAEHLDWGMRLRIAMGMSYCLEYMHQLTPPIAHANLQSSSVYLTEDYAAKLSDFSFWNESTASKMNSATMDLLDTLPSDPESNVYSFGVILFEMITGRLPYSVGNGSMFDWASDYLKGAQDQPFKEIVDPTLNSFREEEVEKLFEVVKDCVCPDPNQRPKMREVSSRLKEITAMGPDGATPKVSPLWWAELEILSMES